MDMKLILETLQECLQREKIIRKNICNFYEHENLGARINYHEELIKNFENLIENNKFSCKEYLNHIKVIENENNLIKKLLDENTELLQKIIKQDRIIEKIQRAINEI
jgi:hypothetical protein